jgi:class 3 adenylate cyclase
VEGHRGIVFHYTGDGLLAIFIAELAGDRPGAMLDRLVNEMCPQLHREFDSLRERWRTEWKAAGRPVVPVGLGAGLSFGRVTMGYIGAYGKKQLGALGEPVNLAALLCAEAEAGTVLMDRGSFERAGFEPLRAKRVRLRSRKLQRRLEAAWIRYGNREPRPAPTWLPTPSSDSLIQSP